MQGLGLMPPLGITKAGLARSDSVAPGRAETISKFEFSNYLNKFWVFIIWNSDLFRVSIFEFQILIYSLEPQNHSLDYVRKFWDTTLGVSKMPRIGGKAL
jgi:hypothetical protein